MDPSLADSIETEPHGPRDALVARVRRITLVAALLGVTASVYVLAVVGPPFYTKGEPREAVVTQRMLARGEYLLGRRSDTELAAKPPLFHWLAAAASAAAGGVSEATMRTPSLAASLLAIALTTLAGCRAFGTTAGLAAGVMLSTSVQWLASSVTARVDMVLAAAMTCALVALLNARLRGEAFPNAFWTGCSLAALAKGPVGYLLPGLVVLAYLSVQRDLPYLRTIRWAKAAPILSIPLGWYALAWLYGGNEFLHTVVAENVYRMIDADAGDVGHRHSSLYYIGALLAGMAPWSVLLPAVGLDLWRRRELFDEPRRFAVVWAVVTLAFYSLVESKRTVYLLSAYPAVALLAGDWLARRFARQRADGASAPPAPSWVIHGLFVALVILCGFVALQSTGVPTLELLAPVLSRGDQANLVAVASAMERRAPAMLLWVAFALAVAAVLASSARRGHWRAACAATAVLVWITAAFGAATLLRDLARTQSIKGFVELAVTRLPQGSPLYFYSTSESSPELYFFRSFEYAASFYARRPLTVVHDLDDAGQGRTFWFVAAEPTLRALRSPAALAGSGAARDYGFIEVARYTYGDNPRRTPVVFVEATRGAP